MKASCMLDQWTHCQWQCEFQFLSIFCCHSFLLSSASFI